MRLVSEVNKTSRSIEWVIGLVQAQ